MNIFRFGAAIIEQRQVVHGLQVFLSGYESPGTQQDKHSKEYDECDDREDAHTGNAFQIVSEFHAWDA